MYSLLSSLVFEANIAGFERTGVSDLFELAAMPIPDRRTSGKEGNNVFYFNSALTLTARIVNGCHKEMLLHRFGSRYKDGGDDKSEVHFFKALFFPSLDKELLHFFTLTDIVSFVVIHEYISSKTKRGINVPVYIFCFLGDFSLAQYKNYQIFPSFR